MLKDDEDDEERRKRLIRFLFARAKGGKQVRDAEWYRIHYTHRKDYERAEKLGLDMTDVPPLTGRSRDDDDR
jgi:hypothetical protein